MKTVTVPNNIITIEREKKMLVKERKIVLLHLLVGLLFFEATTSARPLRDDERSRLYPNLKSQRDVDVTIDVTYTEQIVTTPEALNRIKQKAEEDLKMLNEKSGRSAKFESLGLALPDGGEIRLSKTRTRILSGLKLRNDTTVFANREMTETNFEGTTINTGFGKDSPSYLIDHTLKQVSIWNGMRWSGYEKLRFGKVDETALMDIIGLCNPNQSRREKAAKKKDFLFSGTTTIDGKVVDEIECVDLENGKAKYKISLDPNDWQICRKIVWFDKKSGLVSKIVEYKDFEQTQVTGDIFPRLIVRQYFDKEGKEEKVETINVINVVIGLPISEDIFKLDIPNEYTVIDSR